MKKYILITVFFIHSIVNAQNIDWTKITKDHKPDSKNELSTYFKKQVSMKNLNKAVFAPKNSNIALSFLINSKNKPYAIKINSFGNKLLKKEILEAFENYPLEKLNLVELDKKNRYHLQIISKKKDKYIFNCSSTVIIESPPVCANCDDLEYFEDIKICWNTEVKKHLFNSLDFSLLDSIKEDETKLYIRYTISSDSLVLNDKTKVPSIFKNEVERVLNSFGAIKKEETLNGVNLKSNYGTYITFKKGEIPIYKKRQSEYESFTKPSIDNELSLFFAKHLLEKEIEEIGLNKVYERLIISFEMDANEVLFNIHTNARSKEVNKKVIALFKEYPQSKLNFADITPFNMYSLQLLSFSNNKTIINTSSIVSYLRAPIYPGCEVSKDITIAKKCFSRAIQKGFSKNFDGGITNRIGLAAGRLRVYINFNINVKGEITNIKTRSSKPSSAIIQEVNRVMKLIPKMTYAPVHNGKPVTFNYQFPFSLIVE